MKITSSKLNLLSIVLIGFLLFAFIATKATISSFTHDESFSYLNYCHTSFMQIISFSDWYTNNHILNSLFMKYAEIFFGNSEIALRLPNLILLLVYMLYSYKLFKNTTTYLAIPMFILLCVNPLLIDLFGLARGYGLSYGFMIMSLFHFIEYVKLKNNKDLILFHLAALLACLSNFTMLTYLVAIMLIYIIVEFIQSKCKKNVKYSFINSNKAHILPLLASGLILYEPLRRLLTKSKLDFGGKNGFYADTISDLITQTFHLASISWLTMVITKFIFTLVVIASFIIILQKIRAKEQLFFNHHLGLLVSNFLLILISLMIVLAHILTGADYPISRFSFFLFPIFIVHLGYLVNYFMSLKYEKITLMIVSLVATISSISFIQNANLYSCAEWGYDMNTKNAIETLIDYRNRDNDTNQSVKLGITWLFEPTINYYKATKKLDWLLSVDRNGPSKSDDYCYILKDQIYILGNNYEIIKEYKNNQAVLVKINN